MLHIAQVSGYVDPQRRTPEQLLDAWPTLRMVAESVARAGNRVTVIQAASTDAVREDRGVTFRFVRAASTASSVRPVAAAVRALQPDVMHLNGLRFARHVRALQRALPGTPLLLQDHADAPPSGIALALATRLLRDVHAVAFTSALQAEPFRAAGLFRAARIFEVTESSSLFQPGDRAHARATLGLSGDPIVAWVGRLADVKDPLTALTAFRNALEQLPDARLYCAFAEAPLLADVSRAVAADHRLATHTTLLGRLPHAHVELLLRAADVFLASSRREGSGYALLEALACGATPVVTDIPAFRALTRNRVGRLFPVADPVAGAAALVAAAGKTDRNAVRAHFDAHCSPDALGRQLTYAYDQLARASRPLGAATRVALRRTPARPRVCLLVPGGVDRSGTERVIPCLLALIERLARDVDLHVLALRQEAQACTYELLGATVECVPRRSRAAGLAAIRREHRRAPFDVLHAVWMSPQGTTAALAGRMLRVPVLLHLNGGDLAGLDDIGFGGRATATGRARLRIAVAGAGRITVPSAAMRESALALGIAAQRVTYGVDVQRWPAAAPRPRVAGEPARLLSVASINRVKDHHTLLRAVALLKQRGEDVTLECVGVDTLNGAVQREAVVLGISDIVHFAGFVPHARLRPHYDAADVLVVSSRHEGDPIAALEAALAGVAVVGTHVGHLREWSPDAALTCAPADADALAAVIAATLHDDALRLRLACRAQQHALAHSADAAAARVLELYHELTVAR